MPTVAIRAQLWLWTDARRVRPKTKKAPSPLGNDVASTPDARRPEPRTGGYVVPALMTEGTPWASHRCHERSQSLRRPPLIPSPSPLSNRNGVAGSRHTRPRGGGRWHNLVSATFGF